MIPRRIALVCPYSWSVPGGVQTHVAGLAGALRERGAEVDVLAPADGPADEPGFVSLGRSIAFPDNGSFTRVTLSPTAFARTRARLRAGYDVVHVHEPLLPAAGLTALFTSPAPLVGTFHMVASDHRWYRLFGPLVRRAAARLDGRIAVSEAARDFVSLVLPGHYHVIPNAIDTRAYDAPQAKAGNRIVFVGRPDPRKGLPVLLEAFGRLDGAELDLVGVEQDGFPAGVTAHGRVSDDEKRRLIAAADVVCAPSLGGESFGVVLVEAMAAGVPVVASDIPGYSAVVPEEAGRLVPPGDSEALAHALRALLADGALRERMGMAGRAAAARYDWSGVADRVLAVYEEAVSRR